MNVREVKTWTYHDRGIIVDSLDSHLTTCERSQRRCYRRTDHDSHIPWLAGSTRENESQRLAAGAHSNTIFGHAEQLSPMMD